MRVTLVAVMAAMVVGWAALGIGPLPQTAQAQAPTGTSGSVNTVPLTALAAPAGSTALVTPAGGPASSSGAAPRSAVGSPTGGGAGHAMALPPQPTAGHAASGGVTTLATALAGDRQALTVVDNEARVIAVYHIDLTSGEITLKSVRQISWDLQLTDFNSGHPLPGEVRAMFPSR